MQTPPPEFHWIDEILDPLNEILTVNEVAAALRVDVRYVRMKLIHADPQKRIPAVKVGKAWRVTKSQLRGYLIFHQNDSTVPDLRRGHGGTS